jgi:hypothetical protein
MHVCTYIHIYTHTCARARTHTHTHILSMDPIVFHKYVEQIINTRTNLQCKILETYYSKITNHIYTQQFHLQCVLYIGVSVTLL